MGQGNRVERNARRIDVHELRCRVVESRVVSRTVRVLGHNRWRLVGCKHTLGRCRACEGRLERCKVVGHRSGRGTHMENHERSGVWPVTRNRHPGSTTRLLWYVTRVVIESAILGRETGGSIVVNDDRFTHVRREIDNDIGTLGGGQQQPVLQNITNRDVLRVTLETDGSARNHVDGGQESAFITNLDDVRTDCLRVWQAAGATVKNIARLATGRGRPVVHRTKRIGDGAIGERRSASNGRNHPHFRTTRVDLEGCSCGEAAGRGGCRDGNDRCQGITTTNRIDLNPDHLAKRQGTNRSVNRGCRRGTITGRITSGRGDGDRGGNRVAASACGDHQRGWVHNVAGRVKLQVDEPVIGRIQHLEPVRLGVHVHDRVSRTIHHGRILVRFHGLTDVRHIGILPDHRSGSSTFTRGITGGIRDRDHGRKRIALPRCVENNRGHHTSRDHSMGAGTVAGVTRRS